MTKRDQHDKQQPYNLRVSWSGHQTIKPGTSGTPYDIAWMRFFQADLRRGYALTGSTPLASRRVVATALHDTISMNVLTAGAPAGSVRIGDDGSVAAIVPAGKAITWDMLANDVAKTSQVKERFWVTFQRGEIRTCANCHGINTVDQTGSPPPTNPPAALAALLGYWKSSNPSGSMQLAASAETVLKNAGSVTINVTRSGGSTGPVSVNYATGNGSAIPGTGTAIAGSDYTAATGTLNWADGDSAVKPITITLLNNATFAASKSLSITLSGPTFGTLGSITVNTLTLAEPPLTKPSLDIDDNKIYDALTDGLLIMRHLAGLTSSALTNGAIGTLAWRTQPSVVALYLDALKPLLDVDGDGQINLQTDGVMVLRYLFGLRGSALTQGLIGVGSRPTTQIEIYIQSLMP